MKHWGNLWPLSHSCTRTIHREVFFHLVYQLLFWEGVRFYLEHTIFRAHHFPRNTTHPNTTHCTFQLMHTSLRSDLTAFELPYKLNFMNPLIPRPLDKITDKSLQILHAGNRSWFPGQSASFCHSCQLVPVLCTVEQVVRLVYGG